MNEGPIKPNLDSQEKAATPSWQYKSEAPLNNPATPLLNIPGRTQQPIVAEAEWTASEFIEHSKGVVWYFMLAGGTAVLVAVVYLLTHGVASSVAIAIMAILTGVMASRKPRILDYRLDEHGLTAGQRLYPYSDFKSFAIVNDGLFNRITLYPLKRVTPPVSVYYDLDEEEHIIEVLTHYLPIEVREQDSFDRLSRRFRF